MESSVRTKGRALHALLKTNFMTARLIHAYTASEPSAGIYTQTKRFALHAILLNISSIILA